MPAALVAIKHVGLVTSVGTSAPASCAAIRARISNPTETRFIDSGGEWIMAHQVALEQPWRARAKLAKMAAMAVAECLAGIPRDDWVKLPLLLCIAERERPGRIEGLDEELMLEIQRELDARFAGESAIVPQGRVGVAVALAQARKLIHEAHHPLALIVASDSLLAWPTLSVLERDDRLLTPRNSDGFMPGEAAGALLVGKPQGDGELLCAGLGFAMETAHVASEEPLRAEGLTTAIKGALTEAACTMSDMDYRITDLSGEQYYFKEAALALSRTLRQRKEAFDLWHPAEAIGETGAAAGLAALIVADAAARKAYAPGPNAIAHFGNDAGQRAAAVLRFGSP